MFLTSTHMPTNIQTIILMHACCNKEVYIAVDQEYLVRASYSG